ncbi:hypothetical protein TSOC_005592, partial [Tetrabaena socialis]
RQHGQGRPGRRQAPQPHRGPARQARAGRHPGGRPRRHARGRRHGCAARRICAQAARDGGGGGGADAACGRHAPRRFHDGAPADDPAPVHRGCGCSGCGAGRPPWRWPVRHAHGPPRSRGAAGGVALPRRRFRPGHGGHLGGGVQGHRHAGSGTRRPGRALSRPARARRRRHLRRRQRCPACRHAHAERDGDARGAADGQAGGGAGLHPEAPGRQRHASGPAVDAPVRAEYDERPGHGARGAPVSGAGAGGGAPQGGRPRGGRAQRARGGAAAGRGCGGGAGGAAGEGGGVGTAAGGGGAPAG